MPDGKAIGAGHSAGHRSCVPYSERLATMARVAASSKIEPITTTMKSAHGAWRWNRRHSIRQATRNDDKSRSIVEDYAHHDDDEERTRRVMVGPSMLGYTRGISCRIASSRWRTMTYSRRKVADPKKSSVTMRHERCRTAKPSTRSKMPATSAAFHTASDSKR